MGDIWLKWGGQEKKKVFFQRDLIIISMYFTENVVL